MSLPMRRGLATRGFRDRHVADGRREVDPILSVALAAHCGEVDATAEMLVVDPEQVPILPSQRPAAALARYAYCSHCDLVAAPLAER